MITEEDKKFLEEKFGDGSDYSELSKEDWERFKELKDRYDNDEQKEKGITTPEQSTDRRYNHTCLRCNYYWNSEVKNPIACAKCRSRVWDKPRKSAKRKG